MNIKVHNRRLKNARQYAIRIMAIRSVTANANMNGKPDAGGEFGNFLGCADQTCEGKLQRRNICLYLQEDIVKIIDGAGNLVVKYDARGSPH